ncbi:hypothetical protein P175DRAFT_0212079 [Aspergillus ochraceoroseus IBT 24754]|uniref:Uncharacterized protein n=1 Tax=Aspergillus ochraceoroseus IBT 24754 TaxID=1392256 RepID=A0A2T5M0M3_9EURO|nr:uncharacterized protein P175DRAFT_0212079 [Aspergillus ochraceoroseus IBT 24754]PTU22087.1 hypothetical protein P175DRAFT_0212079 [Aspergillus ochraceoroseus IBT 24754]
MSAWRESIVLGSLPFHSERKRTRFIDSRGEDEGILFMLREESSDLCIALEHLHDSSSSSSFPSLLYLPLLLQHPILIVTLSLLSPESSLSHLLPRLIFSPPLLTLPNCLTLQVLPSFYLLNTTPSNSSSTPPWTALARLDLACCS